MFTSCVACVLALLSPPGSWQAQAVDRSTAVVDYVVGPQDVLSITSYDQAELSGKFTVEADGTFTYPLIGRFKAGGRTLREVEDGLKKRLMDEGFFKHPQVTVTVETYRSQKLFIIGEVRSPGTYPLSGNMTLVEAIARAGSTLPSASGEVVIVHGGESATGPTMPSGENSKDAADVIRINLRQLENGELSQNAALKDGDTLFVPRAQTIYVTGQVKNPAAYTLQQQNTTVLQALALAGGVTDRGSTSRITITRTVGGVKKDIRVKLTDIVQPNDTIVVLERFF
jgi:polysaccharide export outer membrane protein